MQQYCTGDFRENNHPQVPSPNTNTFGLQQYMSAGRDAGGD
jgi:hypothetical protein